MTATAPSAEPWERQPGETREAWQAFEAYRDHVGDGRRSLAKVGQRLGKSTALMERWSVRWSWTSRVQTWEAEQDREWTAEILRQRRIVARRHLDTARQLQHKGLQKLASITVADLSERTALRLVEIGIAIEAGVYGTGEPDAPRAVRIMIDPRLLPPGAQLPIPEDR